MVTRILLGLLGIFFTLQAATAGTPELADAAAALQKHFDGVQLDGKEGSTTAWTRYWAALQDFVLVSLDQNRSPDAIEKSIPKFDNCPSPLVITPLSRGYYAVSATNGGSGNIFIATKQKGHFVAIWDIRNSAMSDPEWGWTVTAQKHGCKKCEFASGNIFKLPAGKDGQPRFAINASYAKYAGATTGGQLSVWAINGPAVTNQFKQNYVFVADDPLQQRGRLIKIAVKDEYRMLFACGACDGRALTWTLKLTPDGVEDLGKHPDVPEADVVDEVFFRLWHDKDASALAAPKALEQMAAVVAEVKKGQYDPKYPTLGMLMSVKAGQSAGRTKLTFHTDVDAAPEMVATVLHKKNGYYLENFEFSLGK